MRVCSAIVWLLCVAGAAAFDGAATVKDSQKRLKAVDAARYDADVVVVLDETDVRVSKNGIGASTNRTLTRVLKEGGVKGNCVQRIDFDPSTNRIDLHAVRIYRADESVEELSLDSVAQQPAPQWGIFWASTRVSIALPNLKVGDSFEVIYTKTGFNVAYLGDAGPRLGPSLGADLATLEPPMPGHWYDDVAFWSSVPVIEKRYRVRLPGGMRLQYGVYNGELASHVSYDGEDTVYQFEKRDISPLKREPRMANPMDVCCRLVLATLDSWEAKARWFYEKNEHAFAVDDAIRAKVAEIVARYQSDDEKITALTSWVADNIRYVGTSRGACEGYTTHAAVETFHDRGGVCKDKAGLLVAMLRAAGYESYIVMTQAGTDVVPVPADQFNHAVTCVRTKDGSLRLLDPTWMPKSREVWSSAEQLQYVVYGTPEGMPLSLSPYSPPAENVLTMKAESSLESDGTLATQLAIDTLGAPETALRRAIAGVHPAERGRLVERWMQGFGPAAIVEQHTLMDAVDYSGPMTLRATVRSPGYAIMADSTGYTHLPLLRRPMADVLINDLAGVADPEKRQFAMRLRSTRRLELRETLTLPAGWTFRDVPEAQSIEAEAASLQFSTDAAGRTLTYTCEVDLKQRTIAPADYSGLRQVLKALEELSQRRVRMVQDTSTAQR